MASYTTNLNLKKPAGSENVAIGDINNNMDTIDQAYGTLSNHIAKFNCSIVADIPFQTGVFYLSANQTIGSIEIPKYTMFICFAYENNAMGIGVRVTSGATYSIAGSAGSWDLCKQIASA